MPHNLSFALHVLTARLDRMGDRLLRAQHGISYRRFLALVFVGELGASTQRALADELGVTEPSVSRMTAVLAADGLLNVEADPAGGNRRRLSLTDQGRQLVTAVRRDFEDRLAGLVEHSGVPYAQYAEHTERLLSTLDRIEQEKTP
ncbi:MarR family winged helix-turn-helix transcriptional regulator [Hamadaea tsunoensis]|uniref:MarR family winged helix-turn-helix transcriptional regulator n=1 Tax=Hamadaea tsunoensis TaxID=53368 RepID=UPI0012F8885A|nr:MarR family transcriptional regulator [Hamadaea tsunoensis]